MTTQILYQQAEGQKNKDIGRPPCLVFILWLSLLVLVLVISTQFYYVLTVGLVLLVIYWYVWYARQLSQAPVLLSAAIDPETHYLHIASIFHKPLMSKENRYHFDIHHIVDIAPIPDKRELMFRINFRNLPPFECGAPDPALIEQMQTAVHELQIASGGIRPERNLRPAHDDPAQALS